MRIYTAIYLVVFFVTGMLTGIPVLYPFLYVIWPIVSGIPFMLFLAKANKFGMASIMAVILGVIWFLMGYTWLPIISYVLCGLIPDFILNWGEHKSFKKTVPGYWVFICGMIGLQAPIWLMTDSYVADIIATYGEQAASQLTRYMPWWIGTPQYPWSSSVHGWKRCWAGRCSEITLSRGKQLSSTGGCLSLVFLQIILKYFAAPAGPEFCFSMF